MKKTLGILLSIMMTAAVIISAFSVTGYAYAEVPEDDLYNPVLAETASELDSMTVYDDLREYLKEQFMLCNETINISSFCINRLDDDDVNALKAIIFYDIMEAFHIDGGYSYSYSPSTNYITKIKIKYNMTKAEYDEALDLCDDAVETFIFDLKNNSSLTDAEKALLVHDRLAQWCEYDYQNYLDDTLPETSYEMYGALVDRIAVCSGYSKAYKYTLNKLGIECSLCDSDAMSHEWNIVTISGEKYHVDVTWDDPIWDIYGKVLHTNFLRSTNGIVSTGHDGGDFDTTPFSTTYDSYYWQNSETEFQYKNGTLYYFDTNAKTLKTYDNGTSSDVLSISSTWKPGATSYYPKSFVRLDSDMDGNYLFYSTTQSIYKYDLATGTSTVVYTPTLPGDYYWIYGFKAQDNFFYLDIYNSPNMGQGVRQQYGIKHRYREDPLVYHNVIYNYAENGGTSASASKLTVEEAGNIDLSVTAQKAGWNFLGWNTSQYATAPLQSLQMGLEDVTLYAIYSKRITASFVDYNGTQKTTSTAAKEIFNKQTSASFALPVQNNLTGWNRTGWTTGTQANASALSGDQTLTQDTTFYGLYARNFTVTYDFNGGTGMDLPQHAAAKFNSAGDYAYSTVTIASEPSREGYDFNGWFDEYGDYHAASSSLTVNEDTVLMAAWDVNTYTVYFDENYPDGDVTSRTVEFGTPVGELPTVPERTGCIFDGWYTEIEGGEPITAETPLTNGNDTTFYAHWIHDDFVLSDGDIPYTVDTENHLIYGEDIFTLTADELLSFFENENMSVNMNGSSDRVHTGIQVQLTDDCGEVYRTMTVVVFGDINGDGWYDGTDSVLASCIISRMYADGDLSAAEYAAADCNHDGNVDLYDVELLKEAGVLREQIDQSEGHDELLETSSAYAEYLSLIDQSAGVESAQEEIEMENAPTESVNPIISFIMRIIAIIAELIGKIF